MNARQCYFIATSWGPRAVPRHFRALADELAGRGHRVVMILDEHREAQQDPGANPAVFTWPSGRPTRLRDAVFLSRLVRRFRPDCVIGNFGSVNLIVSVGWLLRVPRRLAWYHTLTSQVDIDGAVPAGRLRLLRWRKRAIYALATHVVPVSRAAAEDVTRHFGVPAAKCHVLHNSLADPQATATTWAPRSSDVIVCSGRLYPSKGQNVVIEAVARLADTFPSLRVEFLGQGPSLDELVALAAANGVADRCSFTGKISHAEILQRMARACAVVVPSRSEAFGLVTIEALAMGAPVVATATGGTLDIVRDGEEGLLFTPDDPDDLADKLRRILHDRSLAATLSRNARTRFVAAFEQTRLIGAHADWLEAMTADHRRTDIAPIVATERRLG